MEDNSNTVWIVGDMFTRTINKMFKDKDDARRYIRKLSLDKIRRNIESNEDAIKQWTKQLEDATTTTTTDERKLAIIKDRHFRELEMTSNKEILAKEASNEFDSVAEYWINTLRCNDNPPHCTYHSYYLQKVVIGVDENINFPSAHFEWIPGTPDNDECDNKTDSNYETSDDDSDTDTSTSQRE